MSRDCEESQDQMLDLDLGRGHWTRGRDRSASWASNSMVAPNEDLRVAPYDFNVPGCTGLAGGHYQAYDLSSTPCSQLVQC